jgi:hypothetical protein
MKRTALILLLAGGLLGSCENFLEKAPQNDLAAENFYKTEQDALRAVSAAYHHLQRPGCYNLRLWMLDIVAGNSIVGAGGGTDGLETQQAASFATTAANPGVRDIWEAHYGGVLAANLVIDRVPAIVMNADTKARIVGEARFLRALYYFNLVRLFGKVPLLITPLKAGDNLNVPRNEVAQVYAQIEEDLGVAEAALPATYSGSDVGRATKGAAKGLLAKVYLTQKKWAETVAKIGETRALGVYALRQDFSQNFDYKSENGPESLFEVQYTFDPKNNGFSQEAVCSMRSEFMGPRNTGITACCGFGWNLPTAEFVRQFEPGDKRRPATIFLPGDEIPSLNFQYKATMSGTGSNVRKFLVTKNSGAETSFANDPLNAIVLRWADVLLMEAEALNELGQTTAAETPLNEVRSRAGLPAVTGLDPAAFRDAVLKERRLELAFEGERWFDLVRTGTAIPFLKSLGSPNDEYGVGRGNISEKNLLFPIPQAERDNNPSMDQNAGY